MTHTVDGSVTRDWVLGGNPSRVAIMATYPRESGTSNQDLVIEALAKNLEAVVVVSAGTFKTLIDLPKNVRIIERQNVGHDWYSYKVGLQSLRDSSVPANILFTNESYKVIDKKKFDRLIARLSRSTKMAECLTQSYEQAIHMQSYLFFVNSSIMSLPEVRSFWDGLKLNEKQQVIQNYEIGFSKILSSLLNLEETPVFIPSLSDRLLQRVILFVFGKPSRKILAFGAVNPSLLHSRAIRKIFGIEKFEANLAPYYKKQVPSALTDTDGLIRFGRAQHEVGVVLHCFYESEIEEVTKRVEGRNFDFYLTADSLNKIERCREHLENLGHNVPLALKSPNKGRDVRPFLRLLQIANKEMTNTTFLKIHLKKSLHSQKGHVWFERILDGLLSEDIFDCHARYVSCSSTGLSFGLSEIVQRREYDGHNSKNIKAIAGSANLPDPSNPYRFIAGSMFFFSPRFLEELRDAFELSCQLEWEPEKAQLDGTLAHAWERLFLHIAESAGLESQGLAEGIRLEARKIDTAANIVPTVDL